MDSRISLRERIIDELEGRRNGVLNNQINCIPLPFQRFRSELPGIEQGKYYLVSGATKSSKTQLTNPSTIEAIPYINEPNISIKKFCFILNLRERTR